MSLRTYGDKPLSFQLEENGEYYYVGSEVSEEMEISCKTAANSVRMIRLIADNCNCIFRLETICVCSVAHCTKSIRVWPGVH